MNFIHHTASVLKQTILIVSCFVLLVACDSTEKSSSLCETHFNAKSHKVALKHCQKAAKEGSSSAQYYLGMIYIESGSKDEGHKLIHRAADAGFKKAVFHQAVEVILESSDPARAEKAVKQMQSFAEEGDDVAQFWMGNVFLFGHAHQKRSPNEASYWYQKAVDQDNVRAMNNLAWIKALARDSELFDPKEAIRLAQQVVNQYPKSHGYLDTLAAAYAANGQFKVAAEVQNKALELARSKECQRCAPRLIEYYQGHLELYLQQKPLEEDLFK